MFTITLMNPRILVLILTTTVVSMVGVEAATIRIGNDKVTSLRDLRLVVSAKLSMFHQRNDNCDGFYNGGGLYYVGSAEDESIPPKWTWGANLFYDDIVSSYIEASTNWAHSDPAGVAEWICSMSSDGGRNRTIDGIVDRLANRSGGISPVTLSDGARPLWPDRGMTWTIGSSSVGASEFDFSNSGNWFAPDAVPEPSAALLGSIAVVGMLFRRRK